MSHAGNDGYSTVMLCGFDSRTRNRAISPAGSFSILSSRAVLRPRRQRMADKSLAGKRKLPDSRKDGTPLPWIAGRDLAGWQSG